MRAAGPGRRAAVRAGAAAAALVAALTLAACGEDRSTSVETQTAPPPPSPAAADPDEPGPPPARVALAESEYELEPARIRVDRPATLAIDLRNTGAERHALVVEGEGVSARTGPLAPGAKRVMTVELAKPGRYRWYCPVDGHARKGMRGSIQVARGG